MIYYMKNLIIIIKIKIILIYFLKMSKDEKDKKFKQKFKNIFEPKILNSTWEKEGMEVSFL